MANDNKSILWVVGDALLFVGQTIADAWQDVWAILRRGNPFRRPRVFGTVRTQQRLQILEAVGYTGSRMSTLLTETRRQAATATGRVYDDDDEVLLAVLALELDEPELLALIG